jgi:hypothetical protein
MKRLFVFFSIIIPSMLIAQENTNKVVIYEGTIISLQLLTDINCNTSSAGDIIEFETNEPVIQGDRVIIPKGTKASGIVTLAEPRKIVGRPGKLNFTINYLNLANGKVIKLINEQKATGKNKTGVAVAEAILLTPLFLLKKGKGVQFDKGQVFKAFIEKDTDL